MCRFNCFILLIVCVCMCVIAAALPQKKIDRQINEEVRRMMIALFGVLETELNNFILSFEKLDSL